MNPFLQISDKELLRIWSEIKVDRILDRLQTPDANWPKMDRKQKFRQIFWKVAWSRKQPCVKEITELAQHIAINKKILNSRTVGKKHEICGRQKNL